MNNLFAIVAIIGLEIIVHAVPAFPITSDVNDLERNAKALELYLQDRHDHDEHCPFLTWEQPPLDVYKKTLESQLPEECKK